LYYYFNQRKDTADDCTFSSNLSWEDFMERIARKIGIDEDDLDMKYRIGTWKKAEMARALGDARDYAKMQALYREAGIGVTQKKKSSLRVEIEATYVGKLSSPKGKLKGKQKKSSGGKVRSLDTIETAQY
jgi:hypothetical protein